MNDADLAYLAAALYEDRARFERSCAARGIRVAAYFDHVGTQAALVYDDRRGQAALGFRGTQITNLELRDLWSNLGLPLKWQGAGRMHSGYRRHLNMVAAEGFAMAREVASQVPLTVFGHSMGGIVATGFAAAYYHGNRGRRTPWKLAGLVTFGAPRGLSALAVREILCSVRRYVLKGDRAPLWQPLMGFVHPAPAMRLAVPHVHQRRLRRRGRGLAGAHDPAVYAAAKARAVS